MKKDTILAHAGREPEKYQGMVNTPVFRASTILHEDLETYEAPRDEDYLRISYGRHGTPTTRALENAVAQLEAGIRAVALRAGRAGIAKLIRPNTRAVFCESPGSLTFEMQDIPAIAKAAHDRGVPVLADTTWGTPYFFRSFERGVDVSIHAATKYICGHSDVMMGVIVTNEKHWRTVRKCVADYAYSASPDDCYLALRGLRTLGVRMKHQMQSALRVATWLKARPEVKDVLYPALEGNPGHAIWKRDFSGAAALFSFVMQPAHSKQVPAFVNALELFGIGSSWGGYESLAVL